MDTPKLIGPAPLTPARLSEPPVVTAFAHMPGLSADEASVSLAHFLRILRQHAWKVLGFIAIVLAAALLLSLKMERLYESTVVLKIDRHATIGVVGEEASQAVMLNDMDQIITTLIELIQSDDVLRPVAEKYRLLEAEKQLRGLTEDQALRRRAAPITLQRLKVTRPPNSYLIKIVYRANNPQLAADVTNSIAASFITHASDTRKRTHTEVKALISRELTELRAKVETSSQALTRFEGELNLVDPDQRTTLLISRLAQLSTELTVAQTERLRKEAVLNSVRHNRTVAAAQASAQGEILDRALERLNQARQQFAAVKTVYGENYAEYRKSMSQVAELEAQVEQLTANTGDRLRVEFEQALDREQRLRGVIDATKEEVDSQSATVLQFQQLKREAESDKKLYEDLGRRTQEADINNQFQDAVVQIAEAALPAGKHISPNLPLNMSLAFLLSSAIGLIGVVVANSLDTTLWDPEETTRRLNVDVLAGVPAIKYLPSPGAFARKMEITTAGRGLADSLMDYRDAIRGLRTVIDLTNLRRPVRSLLFTSANPSEGKSTTAAHLATSIAEIGKKVLLIDADLRRPTVHTNFNLSSDRGLSDVLMGKLSWRDAIIRVGPQELYMMPAGQASRHASDLIGGGISDLLDKVYSDFEMIIIDAPSMLGCPESQQMAGLADSVVVVVKARSTTSKELTRTLSALLRARANIMGLVINKVTRSDRAAYGFYPSGYADYARR